MVQRLGRNALLLITVLLAGAQVWAEQPPNITYSVNADQSRISAVVDGKERTVVSNDPLSYYLSYVQDFDGDGSTDALFSYSPAGSLHVPLDYKLATYNKADKGFTVSDFTYSMFSPFIKMRDSQWQLTFWSGNAKKVDHYYVDALRRYTVKDGKPVLLQETYEKPIDAVLDISVWSIPSAQMSEDPLLLLHYDLDGDGRKDKILGNIWEVWNTFVVDKIQLASGKVIKPSPKSEMQCKRIGVLAAQTQGMHDLVCGAADIYQWDGTAYRLHPSDFLQGWKSGVRMKVQHVARGDYLIIRKQPGIAAPVVGKIPPNASSIVIYAEEVSYIKEGRKHVAPDGQVRFRDSKGLATWVFIHYGELQGWVNQAYLTRATEPE